VNAKKMHEEYKKGKTGITITNTPYKVIMKDRIVNKKVEDVTLDDIIVHKVDKKIDADVNKFINDLTTKKKEIEKINQELNIEFNIDNYDKHKKKFEYKQTFIRNMAYDQNNQLETKQDFIEFYKKKQKEAEEGKKLCDDILRNIVDEGIISKEEIPK
jgi:hypothetical protein